MARALTRWLQGRPSTTESTVALWAKSLLNAVLFFSLFMVAVPWLVHQLMPQPLPLPAAIRSWGAGALFVAGVGAWIICLDTFSRRGRGTPLPADAPQRLMTGGPFGLVRNPLIAAEIMVVWGVALHVASLGVVLYAAIVTVAGHLVVVHVEEPELRRRFGDGYEAYCRDVPRWLPRLGGQARADRKLRGD